MATNFEKLEKEVRTLSSKQKAALAHMLIEELDSSADGNVEQLWIEEAQRRYEAFRAGELQAVPGEEVMQKARQRIK